MSDYKIELRHLLLDDYKGLKAAEIKAYPSWNEAFWDEQAVYRLLEVFPEGQLCILVNGEVAGAALSLIVDYQQFGDVHTYQQITGNYTFDSHTKTGDTLYGIDVFVHPEYRGMRIGRRLYDARKELCEHLNLKSIMLGGRIPNYKKYATEMTPGEYLTRVRQRELYDPVLTFQLSNDFHPRRILDNYIHDDEESKGYAVLLEWVNIYYEAVQTVLPTKKLKVRVGLVQWQMRLFESLGALVDQAEYFVDAVSDYQSDFILFPELFSAPLMAPFNHLGEAKAMRELASYTIPLRDKFRDLAVSYNVNIICGSMPIVEDDHLMNISYLCRRDGTWDYYKKIHITPSESSAWGMIGGDELRVFDTDCGKVGILVCYDVEFPELSRLYAEQGAEILFVPFLTDTQNGFNRVRKCAEARAVENECYVAIAGCVGNLPRVNNMDINYAQSAIFTPSDFAFPSDGIRAEATPNTEMTVIADLDMELLKELHSYGSVRTLKDRRSDLYEVLWKGGSEKNRKLLQ